MTNMKNLSLSFMYGDLFTGSSFLGYKGEAMYFDLENACITINDELDDDVNNIILIIKEHDFKEYQEAYFKLKKYHCESRKYFCGADTAYCDLNHVGTMKLPKIYDEEKDDMIDVELPVYLSKNLIIEMEHG